MLATLRKGLAFANRQERMRTGHRQTGYFSPRACMKTLEMDSKKVENGFHLKKGRDC
jgi:hypothetical protein